MQPPIADPNSASPPESPHSREMREWLGLMPADFLIYLALGVAGSLYWVENVTFEAALSLLSLVLAAFSCKMGMKPDLELSQAANLSKRYSYPICVAIILGIFYFNFAHWNAI